jgi:hypothetical protein
VLGEDAAGGEGLVAVRLFELCAVLRALRLA